MTEVERSSVQRVLDLLSQGDITPGMRTHSVGAFLSLSPNMDLRVIALREASALTLFYVDHHDAAYRWASNRTVLAEGRSLPELIPLSAIKGKPNTDVSTPPLPIPVEEILAISDSNQFLAAISEMSPEWQEWLFDAYGSHSLRPAPPASSSLVYSPLDDGDLERALLLDLEAWALFLHPKQQEAVNDKSPSVAIAGGPGTGKTVVLLRRIIELSPKGRENDCAVLLTYSEGLAEHLEKQLRNISGRHFYVLPLYYLGGNVPVNARKSAAMGKMALEIDDGQLLVRYRSGECRCVRELLIDEAQDLAIDIIPQLTSIADAKKTRLVLAADLDQAIHRGGWEDVSRLLLACKNRHDLSYCYRSTRQIMDCAREWIHTAGVTAVSSVTFALSGPRVRFIACSDLDEQVEASARIIQDLEGRYDPKAIALIYCQYFNPSFKGGSDEEAALKGDPRTGKAYRFASLTKGKEYFAGVVFVSSSFLAKRSTVAADRLRINTLYVALSRFRNEVTVVYPPNCPIAPNLQAMESCCTENAKA